MPRINKSAVTKCSCGKCSWCRKKATRRRHYEKYCEALKERSKQQRANLTVAKVGEPRRPDPPVDPWEFENWCNDAAKQRQTERYDRGSSTLPTV